MIALILTPRFPKTHTFNIAAGSGVVAKEVQEGFMDVYFEGNLYGASNMQTIEERIYQAASRLFNKYPTVARMRLPKSIVLEYFDEIGQIDSRYNIVINRQSKRLLDKWLSFDNQG